MADKKIVTAKLLVAGRPPSYSDTPHGRVTTNPTWKGWAYSRLRAPGLIIESIEERPVTQ